MRIIVLFVLMVLFWQCQQSSKKSAETTLSGYLSQGDGGLQLRSCGDGKTYTVSDASGALESLYQQACMPAPIPGEAVYAVLTGALSADGAAFTVQRADTVTSISTRNACLGWDFWCNGTEPFWGLRISEAEGGFFFKDIGQEEGAFFAWAAPETDGATSWTYQSGALKVVISKSPCSDGMSDLEYSYTAEVTLGERELKGCAVRSGEPLPQE